MRVGDGQKPPLMYGLAWVDNWNRLRVMYPVPLNWLARWGRSLWWLLQGRSARQLRFERIEGEAFKRGFERGKEEAYSDGYTAAFSEHLQKLEKWREAKFREDLEARFPPMPNEVNHQ